MENHSIAHTWDLVPLPRDVQPLHCGWVHKVKLCADGSVDKLKSCLVARGSEQEEGIDYLETFSWLCVLLQFVLSYMFQL